MNIRQALIAFLEKFPVDATSWADATDELRDLARAVRELLSEVDNVDVEPLDFTELHTPSAWNTEARAYILEGFDLMSDHAKRFFYDDFEDWFVE